MTNEEWFRGDIEEAIKVALRSGISPSKLVKIVDEVIHDYYEEQAEKADEWKRRQ